MIIGICGKSGCGKSTLAQQIINECGTKGIHVDIDKIGHKVLTIDKVKKELIDNFGTSILINNIVDRKKLGSIVFNSKEKMDVLTDITWKYMQIEIDRFIKENNNEIIVLDWLLLPKTKYFQMCNLKFLLDIPYEIRKQRAIKRDNITSESFDLREKAGVQFNENEFDYVIKDNNKINIKRLVKLK